MSSRELRLLLHISNAWQCLGLLRLLRIYWHDFKRSEFEQVVREAEKDIPECAPSCEEDTLLNSEAQVTMLVLEEMVQTATNSGVTSFLLPQVHLMDEVLQRRILRPPVFHGHLLEILCASKLSKILRLKKVCCNIVESSVLHTGNCVAVYCTARCLGIERIEATALSAVKFFFSEIVTNYPAQIQLLPEEWFLEVATSDDLQVTSELKVFFGLLAWIEGDPAGRTCRLSELLGACCRLPLMSLDELYILDTNVLVRACSIASTMIATAYVRHLTTGYDPEVISCLRRNSQATMPSLKTGSLLDVRLVQGMSENIS